MAEFRPENKTESGSESGRLTARRVMLAVTVCAVLLAAAGFFLCGRHLLNEAFLREWDSGRYTDKFERPLLPVNFPESWLPLYHMGNISYMQEDYDAAVSWYQRSLGKNPPAEEKECAVRINLALALLHKIDYEHLDTENAVRTAVSQLKTARSVLTEHGCADPDGTDGHSEQAEQLKKEIDELLKKLQNESEQQEDQQQDSQDTQDKEKEQEDDRQESGREKQIREELEEQRKQSAQERADKQQEKGMAEDGSGFGEFDGKTW